MLLTCQAYLRVLRVSYSILILRLIYFIINGGWTKSSDHGSFGVSSQSVPQDESEFGISVRNNNVALLGA